MSSLVQETVSDACRWYLKGSDKLQMIDARPSLYYIFSLQLEEHRMTHFQHGNSLNKNYYQIIQDKR